MSPGTNSLLIVSLLVSVRRARDSRTELRRFMREMKIQDPEAVCKLEYDILEINGKKYVWSDGLQAVVDTTDNKVDTIIVASDYIGIIGCI